MSLRRLGIERIDLWLLRRIGPDVRPEHRFAALARDAADPGHLAETMQGAGLTLSDEEFRTLDDQGRAAWNAVT